MDTHKLTAHSQDKLSKLNWFWFKWLFCSFCVANTASAGIPASDQNRIFLISPNARAYADIPATGVYNSFTDFGKAVNCILPGDRILIEGGREYQGRLILSSCTGDTHNWRKVVVIRSFHPNSPLDENREVSNAVIRVAPSASELNLIPRLEGKPSFRSKPIPHLVDRSLYKIGPFKNRVNQVFYKDERLPLARFPNHASSTSISRYVPLSDAWDRGGDCASQTCLRFSDAETSISLAKLNAIERGKITDAYVVVRSSPWTLAKARVSGANTKGEVQLGESLHGKERATGALPTPGHGVIFLNSFAFLDEVDEWYFNPEDNYVYVLWEKGDTAPLASQLRFSMDEDHGHEKKQFDNAGLAYWTKNTIGTALKIQGISVYQPAGSGIKISNIRDVEILKSGVYSPVGNGIVVSDISNKSRISGNKVKGAGATGISATATPLIEILDNKIEHSGYIGTQERMEMNFSGINLNPGFIDAKIKSNFIRNAGYAGIMVSEPSQEMIAKFSAMKLEISNNEISAFCQLLNDCGGIYINGQNKGVNTATKSGPSTKSVTANKISDPLPNMDGTPYRMTSSLVNKKPMGDWQEMVAAIYLDRKASHYDVHSNQISGQYKPYSWMIRGGGLFNACSRDSIDECNLSTEKPAIGLYQCYTQELDRCNSISK